MAAKNHTHPLLKIDASSVHGVKKAKVKKGLILALNMDSDFLYNRSPGNSKHTFVGKNFASDFNAGMGVKA